MSTTITIDVFDLASVDAAVRDIEAYAARVQHKTDELRRRVADLIAQDAQGVFNTAVADDLVTEGAVTGNVDVRVESNGENTTLIIASGKDAVFMEFGAGVYHNGAVGTSPNPLGAGLGFTIGSYGKGNGAKRVWGYRGEDGVVHLTHGAPASMPLYNAVQSVSRDIARIAQEVFADA